MRIRYFGLFALFLLLTLLVPAAPAQALTDDALRWVKVSTPGVDNNIVVTPSEVSEIAVASDGTLYALDSGNDKVYKSTNSGASWIDITPQILTAGATMPATKIAIAPDDPNFLALVTDNGLAVYISKSAGGVWINTNAPISTVPTVKIQAIAISRKYTESYESIREIAFGTADWGNSTTLGKVWVCQIGVAWPVWKNQDLTVDGVNPVGEVSAIAYSPHFDRSTDKTIAVVASTGGDVAITCQNQTRVCLGKRDTTTGSTNWNSLFTGFPIQIGTAAGDDSTITKITSSLALPSNFSTADTDTTALFVSINRKAGDAANNVYRVSYDITTTLITKNLDVRNSGIVPATPINISSISYQGTTASGQLIAGESGPGIAPATVDVRRTSDPWDATPSWHMATLPPSGPGNAKVVWGSDGTAYCGTSQSPSVALDESAFSVSSDNGDNWQQESLMDTVLNIDDIAPTPNSQTLFMASYSATNPEGIWRSTVTTEGLGVYWTRQLMVNTTTDRLLIRLSPNYLTDYTIYVLEAGGDILYISHDRGNSWKLRRCLGNVSDAVVINRDTFYVALPGGIIQWTNDGGFTWSTRIWTGIATINTFTVTNDGSIIVGGTNGEVAYALNGSTIFTKPYTNLAHGDIQVAADADFAQNGIIYAASDVADSGVWRWQIGASIIWEQIDKTITSLGGGQIIDGLMTSTDGLLYALRAEPNGGVSRSLNPAEIGHPGLPEFSVANLGLPVGAAFDSDLVFSRTMPFLKLSTANGQNVLWSIDTVNKKIYRFTDILASIEPTLTSPQNLHLNSINSINGEGYDLLLCWNRPSPNVTRYEVGVYADAACTRPIQIHYLDSTSETPCLAMGPHQTGTQHIEYVPGSTYYWRVRVTAPYISLWSVVISYNTQPIRISVPDLLAPKNGAIDIDQMPALSWSPMAEATTYRLLVADNAEFNSPIIDVSVNDTGFAINQKLDFNKTYYWEVRVESPLTGGWSTVANFTIMKEPTKPATTTVITTAPETTSTLTLTQPPQTSLVVTITPTSPPNETVPDNVWVMIGGGSFLVVFTIVLIIATRPSTKGNKKPTK